MQREKFDATNLWISAKETRHFDPTADIVDLKFNNNNWNL